MDGTEAKPTRCGTCRRCGCKVWVYGKRGRIPGICSDCRPFDRKESSKVREYSLQCKRCQRSFISVGSKTRTCCDECLATYRRTAEQTTCLTCGHEFDRWKQGGRSAGKFCSQECVIAYRQQNKRTPKKTIARRIKAYHRKFRSLVRSLAVKRERIAKSSALRPCLCCSKMFRDGNKRLCSNECRVESRRRNRRGGKKKRVYGAHADRCAIRGLPCDSSVTREFIHDRDSWKCLLCGEQTISGDSKMAATIGHIVPLNNPLNLTHGHVASNTFTNCATCNGKQGNAVVIDGHQNYTDPRAVYLQHIDRLGYPFAARPSATEDPRRALN